MIPEFRELIHSITPSAMELFRDKGACGYGRERWDWQQGGCILARLLLNRYNRVKFWTSTGIYTSARRYISVGRYASTGTLASVGGPSPGW